MSISFSNFGDLMEYVKRINNRNLKKLLKKKYLLEETVMEIKTACFIHPSTHVKDNEYSFNYNYYDGRKVIELFTSLEEYNLVYDDNDEYVPLNWSFNVFEHSFDGDTEAILINPATDRLFIPYWVSVLIMDDINQTERTIELNNRSVGVDDLKELKGEHDYLNEYLANKSRITYIDKLFDILSGSVVYVLYESYEPLDEYFKGDVICNTNADYHYYKKDDYIMVFTDKADFKEVQNQDYYYCYGVCDLINVIKIIFELDYDGFILKTQGNEIELARHRLLKYWDRIVENYRHTDIAAEYAFKIPEDEK